FHEAITTKAEASSSENLLRGSNSKMPSTYQREQLAECIVSQLYPRLTGKEN
ncbi:unnamed protein product, partial [Allacma fusca]